MKRWKMRAGRQRIFRDAAAERVWEIADELYNNDEHSAGETQCHV